MNDTNRPPAVRPFVPADREAVLSLHRAVFGRLQGDRLAHRWEWQFVRTPAADTAASGMWVGEENGEIVGFLATLPVRMQLGSTMRVVRHPCDFMVAEGARGKGYGRRLLEAYLDTPNPLANALAYSAASGQFWEPLGYTPVESQPLYLRVRRLDRAVAVAESFKNRPGSRLPGLARPPWRWMLQTGVLVGRFPLILMDAMLHPRQSSDVLIDEIREFGPEFDRLWAAVSPRFTHLTVRDREYLQWRYAEDPGFNHTMLAARDRAGELVGYTVFTTTYHRGLRHGRIMDLFCDPSRPEVVKALVGAVFDVARAHAADVISFLGMDPRIRRVVTRYGFFRLRPFEIPLWVRWQETDPPARLNDAAAWHLAFGDGDEGFSR